MTRLAFDCDTCRHRLAVPADRAGKAVRCPKCRAVMLAPTASSPPGGAVPDLSAAARDAADADSIFSDTDGDGESLFEDVDAPRKPVFPTSADDTQATLRVPGVPVPPVATAAPFTPQPLTLHGTGSATLPKAIPAPIPAAPTPAETTNPFRRMVDEVMSEAREQDAAEAERDDDEPAPEARPAGEPAWKSWALVAVSVYALLATAAAVWGWTRTLPEKPPAVKQTG